jgi:hemerythrin superfamily protein
MAHTAGEKDVVALLLDQHERIRRLFEGVAEAATSETRRKRFEELRALLAVHETAEELVTHPRARMHGANDVVDALLEEEHQGKEMLAGIEKLDVDDPEFDKAFRALRTAVLEHADHEERAEFPRLREENDETTLRLMAAAVRAAESVAPTHPHPAAGESVTVNAAVGPVVGIADRARDAVRGVMG